MEINPRKEEVEAFMGELDHVMNTLGKKQQLLNLEISNASQVYQEEEGKVEDYYGQFYEIIE